MNNMRKTTCVITALSVLCMPGSWAVDPSGSVRVSGKESFEGTPPKDGGTFWRRDKNGVSICLLLTGKKQFSISIYSPAGSKMPRSFDLRQFSDEKYGWCTLDSRFGSWDSSGMATMRDADGKARLSVPGTGKVWLTWHGSVVDVQINATLYSEVRLQGGSKRIDSVSVSGTIYNVPSDEVRDVY